MNILWLYQFKEDYNFDSWLHLKFVEAISRIGLCGIKAYGPGIHNAYPHISLCPYNESLTLDALWNFYKFDVVIVDAKSRCFFHYNPKTDEASGCWLPKDFSYWFRTPKIIWDEDQHYEKSGKWYQDMKFNLVLCRHYSQSLRDWGLPTKFLPFSVDISEFNKDRIICDHRGEKLRLPPYEQRQKLVAFVGNSADSAYVIRRNAINRLLAVGMGANFAGAKKVDGEYIQVLRQYIGYLSCGSTYEISAAKNFEIMASGGALLTNKFQGIDLLFPPDTYSSYNNDCSDIEAKANIILNDNAYTANMVQKAHLCIRQRHTHEVRLRELIDIIQALR